MSPSERREMIRKENTDLSLTRQCKLLKISRSSIYYTPVGFDQATIDPMHEIDQIFTKYPFFGSRQIAAYLPQSGFSAGRHRVRRLMGIMGLQAIYKGPNTSKKHPEHRIYPYLLRKLPITRPNQVPLSHMQACAAGQRVQRHHLHPSQKRLSVSGGDHGLGDAKSADLAAFKYAGC
jgi:putative transposase